MRTIRAVLFTLAILLSLTSKIHAQNSDWIIDSFESFIELHQDTSVTVTETIQTDFNDLRSKHGIIRTIPVKYQTSRGNNLSVRFELIEIRDQNNYLWPVEVNYQGRDVILKIGRSDQIVSGKQTFKIKYKIQRVIKPLADDQAEFYWNVTGNDWEVPILSAQATIKAPSKLNQAVCFTGEKFQSAAFCDWSDDGSEVKFFTTSPLIPTQGLTVATAYDKNSFVWPSAAQEVKWFVGDNLVLLLPLTALIVMLWLWWIRGRDQQYRNMFHQSETETVPIFGFRVSPHLVYSPPENISPGEVGTIIDEQVNPEDITAILIDLARRGHFKIKEIEKKGIFAKTDFEFERLPCQDQLKPFEADARSILFADSSTTKVSLSKLPKKSFSSWQKTVKSLYSQVTQEGYFTKNPNQVRSLYLTIGLSLTYFGAYIVLNKWESWAASTSVISTGFIIALFSLVMPSRTAKGRKALREIWGLKEWIKIGSWREKIHEKHNFLEEVLPFAIAFGMTEKFLNAFQEANLQPPDWFVSNSASGFTHFSHSMNHFSRSLNQGVQANRPKSASSGGSGFSGGFSGGGFGGGGGRSW